ncbi:hypothetical protein [Flavobacterium columnare]|uniref:hypothetical protein n=1 Tax=Flavobacterium columnare TaxID=996 RepID=UPI000FD9FE75|nr:hypothetical protein [Flavobacterium columnare]MCH4829425.1 hypothetical protein [Flavobacterium columnare]MCH4834201.1 hypothetical protein [Flavobacterium columnare]
MISIIYLTLCSSCFKNKKTDQEFYFLIQYILSLIGISNHKATELKIMIIDNAAFRSTKDVIIPENIFLLPIPSYSPEPKPTERI